MLPRGGVVRGRSKARGSTRAASNAAGVPSTRGGRGGNQTSSATARGGASLRRATSAATAGLRGRGTSTAQRGNTLQSQQSGNARGGTARAPIVQSKLKKPPPNADFQTRYEIFKENRNIERTDAIKNGFIADPDRPRTLAEAITPVGTCPDMCAEWERLERIVQNDVWSAEYDPEATDAQGKRVPDEARMVKKFRRAAAGLDEQLPSDLRPPPVLQKTLDYLFNELLGSSALAQVHHFVWDRTRAVRNDFSIQQVSKVADLQITIQCYERIARFHILSLHQLALAEKPYDKYDAQQEREQLDKTLLSLMQLYDDSRARVVSPYEPEFRAYCVIFQIQNSIPDLEDRVQTWPDNVANHPRVQRALRLYAAATNTADAQGPLKPRIAHPIAQANWRRFWSLVKSKEISYLMACVAEIYFPLVRRTALNAIWKSYRASSTRKIEDWTLDELIEVFGFETQEQVQDLCISYGFTIAEREDGVAYLDLNSVAGRSLPDPPAGSNAQRKSEFVEQKRYGRTLSAVINGLSIHAAQMAGLVEKTTPEFQHTGRASTQKGNELFVSDGSDDEKTPPTTATRNTFGKPSSFNPFASSFVPSPVAVPTQQSQQTSFTSSFGLNTSQPSAVGSSNQSPFSFNAQLKAPTASDAQPANLLTTFDATQPSLPAFGGFATPAGVTTSPFAQPQNPSQEPIRSQQMSEVPKPSTPRNQQNPTPSPFAANPLPSFDFGQTGTGPKVQKLETATASSPIAASEPPSEGKTFGSSPFATITNQSPAFDFKSPDSAKVTFAAIPSAPSFSFPSLPQATQSPLPSQFTQPTSIQTPTPSFTYTPAATSTAPLPDSQHPTSESISQTPQQSSSTDFAIQLPNSNQQPPAPLPSVTSKEELQRKARFREAAEARKSVLLGQVSKALVVDKYGLLEQFVEYTAISVIRKARQQVLDERAIMQADQFRLAVLSQRYGRRWRQVCLNRRLARQGRERRRRLARDVEARARRSRESSIASQVEAFRDTFKSSQSSLTSSNVRTEELPLSSGEGRLSSSMPVQNESWASASQTSNISFASTTRSVGTNGINQITPYSIAKTPRTSRRLRDSSLENEGFRLTSSTLRQDTTRSTYFKLKAMGLDPNSTTLHTFTASAPTVISSERKRPRTDSLDSSAGPGKRPFTASSSLLASTLLPQPEANIANTSSSKPDAVVQDPNDDDEILLAARQVRQAMAESMTLFQDEIAKDEKRKSESSHPNAATTRNASRSLGAEDFGITFRSTAPTSLAGRASRFVEPPPKYRSRVSKFLPRERYADIQAHRRPITSVTPRTTPSASRRSETLSRAVAQPSTYIEQKKPANIDNVIDLDDEEPEVQTNGWHQNEHEPSPTEVNSLETLDPMLATYASSAMYAPIQYDFQAFVPYTAQPPLQESPQGHGEVDSQDHVGHMPTMTTFPPLSPNLRDDVFSSLAYEAAQFVPQPNHSPSVEPSNSVSARYPTPPPPPVVDEEVEILSVVKHPSPNRQPVPSPPPRSPSPVRQVRPERKEIPKQRQVSQQKRPHHRQASAPHVNPFALLAGMDDGDDGDDPDEEEEDDEGGGGAASVAEEAVDEMEADEEPRSEAEEEEHEFVDEKEGQLGNGQDNGYYEEDDGQYDEEHGFNDDSASGNGRYSVDDDVEGDEEGGEGEYDEELDEDESEEEDDEEEEEEEHAPPPPSAWDGKGGSVEDAIEL